MMLKYYSKRYDVIIQGKYPVNRKKIMLTNLLNEMEKNFDIPMQSNPEWDKENSEVIALYRQITASKNQ